MVIQGVYFPIELPSGEDAPVVYPHALFDPERANDALPLGLERYLRGATKDWDLSQLAQHLPRVRAEDAKKYFLRKGDSVVLRDDGALVSVWDNADLNSTMDRPGFTSDLRRRLRLRYANAVLPLGQTTQNTHMLIVRAMCPVGEGGLHLIVGPASSGKSTTSRVIADEVITLAENDTVFSRENTVVIYVCGGERDQDYAKTLAVLRGHPNVRWEYYVGFAAVDTAINAQIGIERGRRYVELGYKVIMFFDSLGGLVLKMGQVPGIGTALAGTGVSRDALNIVKDAAMVAGTVEGSPASLSVFATCLSTPDGKTAHAIILGEIGEGVATTMIEHFTAEDQLATPYPWIDPGSKTRELGDMFTGAPDDYATYAFIQGKLANVAPEKRVGLLRDMFNEVHCFELAKVEEWFRVHETKVATNGWQRAHQNVINAATQLLKLQPHQKLSALAALMEQGGMGKFAEALVLLLKLSQPTVRDEVFALLVKEDLMPKPAEVPPADLVLQVAEKLRGAPGLRQLLVKAIIAAGLTVDQLLVEEGDGALVEEIHAAFAGKFKKSVARQLVAAGYIDVEELRLLLKSTTPKALISKPRRSS